MKHKNILILVTALFCSLHAEVETISGAASIKNKTFDELHVNGSITLKNIQATILVARGALDFKELTLKESLDAKGGCSGKGLTAKTAILRGGSTLENTELESLDVRGGFSGTNITVTQNVEASGGFNATKLTVKGLTTVRGGARFTGSTLQNVHLTGKEHTFQSSTAQNVRVLSSDSDFDSGFGILNWVVNLFRSTNKKAPRLILTGDTIIHGDITFESSVPGEITLSSTAKITGKVINGEIR